MQKTIIGELFGVEIYSPITRGEVRQVVKNQLKAKNDFVETGLTEDQAQYEIIDIFQDFFKKLSNEDRKLFDTLHAEEVSVAPKEWFGKLIKQDEEDKKYLDGDSLGELFGVEVTYPISRENVRKIVLARSKLMNAISSSQGISLYQASNDLNDVQSQFLTKMNYEDQEKFLNIMTDELIAHTNALNDQTNALMQENLRKEVDNQNIANIIGYVVTAVACIFLFYVVLK